MMYWHAVEVLLMIPSGADSDETDEESEKGKTSQSAICSLHTER